jgi:hypothetical protein
MESGMTTTTTTLPVAQKKKTKNEPGKVAFLSGAKKFNCLLLIIEFFRSSQAQAIVIALGKANMMTIYHIHHFSSAIDCLH